MDCKWRKKKSKEDVVNFPNKQVGANNNQTDTQHTTKAAEMETNVVSNSTGDPLQKPNKDASSYDKDKDDVRATTQPVREKEFSPEFSIAKSNVLEVNVSNKTKHRV